MAKQKRRAIGEFRDIGQFAVALYNQDLSDAEKALAFVHKFRGKPTPDNITMYGLIMVQKQFKAILDHVLSGMPPDVEEMVIISKWVFPKLVVVRTADPYGWRIASTHPFWTEPLFQWLIQVANQETTVPGKCYAPDCNRLFIQTSAGHRQKYCSGTCRNREGQRRRRRRLSRLEGFVL